MRAPVDVVVAVHAPTRPIARAVASVLDDNGSHTRLTVVCHNVSPEVIGAELPPHHRDQVRWLEHRDDAPSASGPFNAGMRAATGDFVSIMGSDDTLQPGAVASWLQLARKTGAECVMTRLAIGGQARRVPTPPTRLFRVQPRLADAVRDRLSYRSAPLGLVSTRARLHLGAELVEGMPVGGDVPYVTRLWCETKVAVDAHGPGYVIGEDARDRVTYAPRPIEGELGFIHHLLEQPWFQAYPEPVRTAVATKMLRIHLFGVVVNRAEPAWWTQEERAALGRALEGLLRSAPRAADPLSKADHRVVEAIRDPRLDSTTLIQRAQDRRHHGRPGTLIPQHPLQVGHREAPLRFMAASWWAHR